MRPSRIAQEEIHDDEKSCSRAAVAAGAAASVVSSAAAADGKFPVYLSMSYVGNGWQSQATNMISAMAKYYSDKIDLHIQVAGPVAQRQIQQIDSMVQAGAKAIIVYPISPTALNAAIKNACDKGVVVFAYDYALPNPAPTTSIPINTSSRSPGLIGSPSSCTIRGTCFLSPACPARPSTPIATAAFAT